MICCANCQSNDFARDKANAKHSEDADGRYIKVEVVCKRCEKWFTETYQLVVREPYQLSEGNGAQRQ